MVASLGPVSSADSTEGLVPSETSTSVSRSAAMELCAGLPEASRAASRTAPAATSSCGSVMACTADRSWAVIRKVSTLLSNAVCRSESATPPEDCPDSRTAKLAGTASEAATVSENVTCSVRAAVLSRADSTRGAKPSNTRTEAVRAALSAASSTVPEPEPASCPTSVPEFS